MNAMGGKGCCGSMKSSGTKFGQQLVDQTPVFDKRKKHNRPMPKHRGNLKRPVKYLP